MIEFEEFLQIIKNADNNSGGSNISKFFKDLSMGKLGGKDLNFNVFVSNIKIGYMMDKFLSRDREKKDYGEMIFKNVA